MGAQVEEIEETNVQKETRIRLAKTRRALVLASDAAWEMAVNILPKGGSTEAGEDVRVARIPFRGRVLDDLNELYGALVEAVIELVEVTREGLPIAAAAAKWQARLHTDEETDEEYLVESVYGLPDRFSAGGAKDLVRSLCLWLSSRMEHLVALPDGPAIADGLSRLIWQLRYRYKVESPATREIPARPCPICGDDVLVRYFAEPFHRAELRGAFVVPSSHEDRKDPKSRAGKLTLAMLDGVTVACSICAWKPPARPDQIVRWLEGDRHDASRVRDRKHRDLSDPKDTWWTVEQAAEHFAVKPATIRAWIRGGAVTKYPTGLLQREQLLETYRARCEARKRSKFGTQPRIPR